MTVLSTAYQLDCDNVESFASLQGVEYVIASAYDAPERAVFQDDYGSMFRIAGWAKPDFLSVVSHTSGWHTAASTSKEITRTSADPWFYENLERIRHWAADVSGAAVDVKQATRHAAEALLEHLSILPSEKRPTFAIDEDGEFNFISAMENYYFHISIDGRGLGSIYVAIDGNEYLADDFELSSSTRPEEIAAIFPF